MIQNAIAHPKIVEKDEWLTARKTLLEHEKELTKHRDRINNERRKLPMVKLDKEYTFEEPNGSVKLIDLFAGRTQLIIYHFMFAPGLFHSRRGRQSDKLRLNPLLPFNHEHPCDCGSFCSLA